MQRYLPDGGSSAHGLNQASVVGKHVIPHTSENRASLKAQSHTILEFWPIQLNQFCLQEYVCFCYFYFVQ
jgi:hypothetical protein